jgi:hypothetical protein
MSGIKCIICNCFFDDSHKCYLPNIDAHFTISKNKLGFTSFDLVWNFFYGYDIPIDLYIVKDYKARYIKCFTSYCFNSPVEVINFKIRIEEDINIDENVFGKIGQIISMVQKKYVNQCLE